MTAFYGSYYYPHPHQSLPDRLVGGYLRVQTAIAGRLIGAFDESVAVAGTVVLGAFPLQIVKDCSSLDAQALLVAAILAFPASRMRKLAGVVLGLLVLNALNLLRITSLYFIGLHARQHFDSVHEELMPLMLIVAAALCFSGWAAWARDARVEARVKER